MSILHIDFETRSACEPKDRGLDNYAKHPSTDVHCMAFAFDDEPVQVMRPGRPAPAVPYHVENGGLVYAHNASFELAIWSHIMVPRYGWPILRPEQVRCTMVMCYAMGLPGALENAAPALGITERKDAAGKRTMMLLAKPRTDACTVIGGRLQDHTFWTPETAPEKFAHLYDYCKQDVEVERALHHRLMELSPSEQNLWTLDQTINNRGVRIDLPSIEKAIKLVDAEKARLNARMLRVTQGVVGSCTEVQLLAKWVKLQGVNVTGLAKAAVLDALSGDLPANVREALELRKEAAKSSTAKLVAMKERASSDGRVRGIHQFHGANTGRWAGRGIQLQNFPRNRPTTHAEDVDDIFAHLHDRDYIDAIYGPTMDAIADCMRGMIVPAPGHDFVAADFSAVEARVLAWLAGEESVLEIFRGHGKIYEHAAAGIYHVPMDTVTKNQRQIGKVAVLALGYGGGIGAFQSMAKNYGIKVPDAEADEIKSAWREAHPNIVSYWYEVERAAIEALTSKGTVYAGPVGRQVAFRKAGSFLWCKLPSGRCLCYPYPEIRTVTTPWGAENDALTYMTVVADTKGKILPDPNSSGKWCRISTYGGSLAENLTQAVARDLLAEAMVRLEAAGFPIVFHVHDEVITEVPKDSPADTLARVERIMSEVPAWATGLPLAAEGWRGPRFRK